MGNQRQGTEEFLGGGNCRTTKDGYRVVNDGELGEWHRMTDGKLAAAGVVGQRCGPGTSARPDESQRLRSPGEQLRAGGEPHDERLVDEQKWWCDRVYAHEVAEKHLTGEDARKVRAAWGKKGVWRPGKRQGKKSRRWSRSSTKHESLCLDRRGRLRRLDGRGGLLDHRAAAVRRHGGRRQFLLGRSRRFPWPRGLYRRYYAGRHRATQADSYGTAPAGDGEPLRDVLSETGVITPVGSTLVVSEYRVDFTVAGSFTRLLCRGSRTGQLNAACFGRTVPDWMQGASIRPSRSRQCDIVLIGWHGNQSH